AEVSLLAGSAETKSTAWGPLCWVSIPLRSVQRIYSISRYAALEHHRVRRHQIVRGRGELDLDLLHLGREHRDGGAQGMRQRSAAGGAACCAGNEVGKW